MALRQIDACTRASTCTLSCMRAHRKAQPAARGLANLRIAASVCACANVSAALNSLQSRRAKTLARFSAAQRSQNGTEIESSCGGQVVDARLDGA
jgi:hypothetical protein